MTHWILKSWDVNFNLSSHGNVLNLYQNEPSLWFNWKTMDPILILYGTFFLLKKGT